MDTNNLDKWWYGLPGKHQTGYRKRWNMGKNWICRPVRRYTDIPGLEFTDRQRTGMSERTLLNEIACGLGDLCPCP